MNSYHHLAARLFNTPLLIHPGKLSAIVAGLSARFSVQPLPDAYAAPQATRQQGGYRVKNGVGIIDIFGILAHHGGMQADSSYILGYETLSKMLSAALADSAINAILLNIDSPGGEVSGSFQLADQIYRARSTKPIAAVASDLAASAAYLLASAAESVSITRSGIVGSIGVVTCYIDISRALDQAGVAITMIYAGSHKVDGNPYQPLPPDVAAQIQVDVDHYYSLFLDTVAGYRPSTPAAALRDTEAQTYIGPQALAVGLADYLETPDQVIARLAARDPRSKPRGQAARRKSMATEPLEDPTTPADVSIPEPPPADVSEPAARALDVVSIVRMCNAAGEPRLAEILVGSPHTAEQVQARLTAAADVHRICALAQAQELADGLIAAGANRDSAMIATWQAMAARSAASPVDAAPPARAGKVRRAAFDAMTPLQRRDYLASGGTVTD